MYGVKYIVYTLVHEDNKEGITVVSSLKTA
jgi:hypothetical protein